MPLRGTVSLQTMLESHPGWELCAEAADVRTSVKHSMQHKAKQGLILTARERKVVQLVAEGRTINGIVSILNVAGRRFSKTNIMDELNLRTTADLT